MKHAKLWLTLVISFCKIWSSWRSERKPVSLAHSHGTSLDAAGDAAFRAGLCLWGKGWVSWIWGLGKACAPGPHWPLNCLPQSPPNTLLRVKPGECHEVTPPALTRCFRSWKAGGKRTHLQGQPGKILSGKLSKPCPSHRPPFLPTVPVSPRGLWNPQGAFFHLYISKAFLVLSTSDSRHVSWKKQKSKQERCRHVVYIFQELTNGELLCNAGGSTCTL